MEFSELEGMLRPILQDVVQDAPSTSKPDGAASSDQLTQRTLARLWKLINDSNEDRAGHLAGVPLPEVDAELLPLQQEVDAALARLNARRLAVPAVVEAATRAKLEAQRESLLRDTDLAAAGDGDDLMAEAGAVGAAGAREGEGAGAATVGGAEDARELLRRTTATTDRLPAIRARLDEALHRLQTNLGVLGAGEGGARASPKTVERVIMRAARTAGKDAGQGPLGGAGGAPAAAAAAEDGDAGESGADATRRCLARELA
ncbi:hypothetical protein MNEG_4435 [Monoraphidium neglectum]|uniref:Uncharacterized protein n=1 Tax=Monoraphidium neglectum TaxID=145388 RepID=A0A0D2MKS0_9CHLO|nr:hypothetical protein MNEG_4435 [Monoraphidium neglectum]KIZ03520.1 hypothetical protein MNEG_4435 [Monoraphidium neglectum]|eukprot:XP_013902539.1 hypothetical protein MNEG_4435 [Monoraphidium neglectum]